MAKHIFVKIHAHLRAIEVKTRPKRTKRAGECLCLVYSCKCTDLQQRKFSVNYNLLSLSFKLHKDPSSRWGDIYKIILMLFNH